MTHTDNRTVTLSRSGLFVAYDQITRELAKARDTGCILRERTLMRDYEAVAAALLGAERA